jgi:hypothetical protein
MSEALVFGNIKHPPFVDRLVTDAQNGAWDPLGPRKVLGVAQHTMVGSLWGTDSWFRRGAASNGLTDYGIGGASDGPDYDGVIFRWNDPTGKSSGTKGQANYVSPNRWPWASGPTNGLEGDGTAFVNKYGSNAVNGYLVSIERSDGGNPDTPPSAKYLESFAQLMAYYADLAQCPYDTFPILPVSGLTFHYWHLEFSTRTCPNPAVTATVDQTQDRVREILKAGQTQGVTPPVPEPVPPDTGDNGLLALPAGMSWELVARLYGSYAAPWGTTYQWNQNRAPCRVWYQTAVRSIPAGESYEAGSWPPLEIVIRRGDQTRCLFQWSNGMTYEAGC